MPTSQGDLRARTGRGDTGTGLKQALRRMVLRATAAAAQWTLAGFTDDAGNEEKDEADLFHGVGTFARPPAGKGAAIVILQGGKSGAPMIVATRDIATLLAVLAKRDVGADESLFFNSQAGLHVKANGDMELRTHDGQAGELATKADIDAIWRWLYAQFAATGGHVHVVVGGATTTMAAVPPLPAPGLPSAAPPTAVPPIPVGTIKTKAE